METTIEKPVRKLGIEREIRINGYDIDVMGIVSNIVYVRYFEDLRMDFLDKYYPYSEMIETGISPILMHTEVDYKIPLTIHDQPTGRSWVTKLEKMRWEFQFEIVCGDSIHAVGIQRGAFYDMNKGRPAFIPPKLVKIWDTE